ncbi:MULTISPECIES: hypothetical protein [unclassified Streptomyces]|uniref:hypothetical protein n=1 Tax=unclassified Streptomyces TaxID=2593676 RepID=UPI000823B1F6|nr:MULTISPECIES: hypothetical protein [unclassified Streptomyces]MYT98169.1 hypothetical protein [Streptomyces sp. SID8350]SCK35521.1 hypothetical protein YUWDRAFT_02851 [Streptomyces sp. AmelKG-D3]
MYVRQAATVGLIAAWYLLPAGVIRDEAQLYLGPALEGEGRLDLALPLGQDWEVAPARVADERGVHRRLGGEPGVRPLVEVFGAVAPSLVET